jgi:L-aspartate oxidase
LVRSAERIARAMRDLRSLWSEIETFYRITKLSDELIGLRNAVEAALVIAQAAQHNRQSLGAHFRKDSAPNEGERLI